MIVRRPSGFIAPCLPSKVERPLVMAFCLLLVLLALWMG